MKKYDINEIMKLIPHRYPILLVDRILDVDPGKTVKALKNVTINEPYFNGHFPQEPVMPGMLVVEGMAQAAATMIFVDVPEDKKDVICYLASLEKAKFRGVVVPGDQIRYEIECIQARSMTRKFSGKAFVDDKLVCEAVFVCIAQ